MTTNRSNNLRPCPFCGSSNTTLDYYEISCPQELGTIVVCNDCGASAKSIVDWNCRPIEDALTARIAELEKAQRWIPVSKSLPEDGEFVLAWDDEIIEVLEYKNTYGGASFLNIADTTVYPTHWMPLPEPPEGA